MYRKKRSGPYTVGLTLSKTEESADESICARLPFGR